MSLLSRDERIEYTLRINACTHFHLNGHMHNFGSDCIFPSSSASYSGIIEHYSSLIQRSSHFFTSDVHFLSVGLNYNLDENVKGRRYTAYAYMEKNPISDFEI